MKIKELLVSEEQWTKGMLTRGHNGVAKQWCLLGAIVQCYSDEEIKAIAAKIHTEVGPNITGYNDAPERKFSEIKALVEKLDI